MLSTFILSIVTFLQGIHYEYLYLILAAYLLLLWISFSIAIWKDTGRRFEHQISRILVWFFTTITFVFGFFLYLLARPMVKEDEDHWSKLERRYLTYETYGMEECHICGYLLRPEFLYCPSCGDILRKKCEVCENVIDIGWNVCPYCANVNIAPDLEEEISELKDPLHAKLYRIFILNELEIFYSLRNWISARLEVMQEQNHDTIQEEITVPAEEMILMVDEEKSEKEKSKKDTSIQPQWHAMLTEAKKLFFIEEKATRK